ncbi:uncharacterized protein IL334_004932 [Kwoniella shivajii]|uniref:Uncharacterized protein n=1 Tax=Kwoniella shivajii TaxID=564305 RepID=A0ABZ1D1R1_9TREE|nr:hypothetical protein IL334_004932 [Kwoniella shivajii]
MSLQDRLSAQDSLSLLTTATSLALVTAGSTTGFGYNFPLMLFGIVAHEMHSSTVPFRQFLNLVLFTAIFDLWSLLSHKFSFFILLFSILLFLIKIPLFFSCLTSLRERGGDISFDIPRNVSLPGGGNWNVPAMPGGFSAPTSGNTTGPQLPGGGIANNQQTASFPSSGGFRLGGEDEEESQGNQPPAPAPGRNGYSTIA